MHGCLRRMTNGDEQKRRKTSQQISQLMMMISRLGARLAARGLFMKPFDQKEGGNDMCRTAGYIYVERPSIARTRMHALALLLDL